MKTYKEFWIVDNCEQPCLAFEEKKEAMSIRTYPDKYHVIEYDALLDCEKRYEKTYDELYSRHESLQKKAEKLLIVVKHVTNLAVLPQKLQDELVSKARQALKEFESEGE